MDTATIRQQLHEYIEQVDDKKARGLYMLVEEDINNQHIKFSDEQLAFLNEEYESYLKGDGKTYSREEAMDIIRQKRKI